MFADPFHDTIFRMFSFRFSPQKRKRKVPNRFFIFPQIALESGSNYT